VDLSNSRVCLIFNPASGLSQRLRTSTPLETIVRFFSEKKVPISIKATENIGDGTILAEESVREGYTHIVACGGDGTVNEVVNGTVGNGAVLGIIPFGTANVLARTMRIPVDIVQACRKFYDSEEKTMDIGVANGRNYLTISGIGFDAGVIRETPKELKDVLGSFGYILKGTQRLISHSEEDLNIGIRIRLLDQDREMDFKAWIVLVANLAYYSSTIKVGLKAKPDDGKLDIIVFPYRPEGKLDVMKQLYLTLTEADYESREIPFFQSSEFEIITNPLVPCHADGELIGNTPVHYTIKANALKYRW
jgi:diacylglycerol kinase (ATP)